MLAPGFRLPAIYCKYWHTSLLSFPSSFPPFLYFLCPSLFLYHCFTFFCFFLANSQRRKHFCLHLSKFLPRSFFSTPFKRANTSLIFPLNTLHSFCLYPRLLSLSLFPGVTRAPSAIRRAAPSLLACPLSWISHRLTLMLPDLWPASSELWHSHTLINWAAFWQVINWAAFSKKKLRIG